MKIYIVFEGEYSDRFPVAVFSTKENAIKFSKTINKQDDIQVFELDNIPTQYSVPDGMKAYEIAMLKDGTFLDEFSDYELTADMISSCNMKWEQIETDYHTNQEYLRVWTFARNKKHAIKITNERRTQIIANNLWNSEYYKLKE